MRERMQSGRGRVQTRDSPFSTLKRGLPLHWFHRSELLTLYGSGPDLVLRQSTLKEAVRLREQLPVAKCPWRMARTSVARSVRQLAEVLCALGRESGWTLADHSVPMLVLVNAIAWLLHKF